MAISRDKVLREAEKLVQKGKLDAAIRKYEKLLAANPNDVTTINRIGDLYGKVGQIDKAVELYERIADFFVQDGFLKKAIAVYKKINRMAPQRLEIFERLAELYVELGLKGEAKTQYQILADWYAKNGDRENALKIQRRLADLDPGNHVVQLRLADMLMEAGVHDEGLEAFGQLIQVLLERQRIGEAEKLAQHILDLDPPSGEFLAPICTYLLDNGQKDRAAEFLDKGLAISPDSAELKALRARLALVERAPADISLEMAESLLSSDPDNLELREIAGRKLMEAGEGERARDVLEPVIHAALRRGDLALAQELTAGLRQVLGQDLKVLLWSLRAVEPSGDRQKIVEIKGEIADVHYAEKRYDAAQALYMELAELDPENTYFRQRLLELSSRLQGVGAVPPPPPEPGRPAAPAAVPAGADPDERLGEARVFAKYGLLEKAIRHLEELLRAFPEHVEARHELVRFLCEDGQRERAREIAGPLKEHYRATMDREGLSWLEATLGPAATPALEEPSPSPQGPAEEQEEEEILFLDLDADEELLEMPEEAVEVPERAAESPVAPEAGSFVDGGPEYQAGTAPPSGPGSLEPDLDLSWVDEAIQLDRGIETGTSASKTPVKTPVPAVEEVAASPPVTAPEGPAQEPAPSEVEFPEEVLAEGGEDLELLDITGVVAGPSKSDLGRLDFFIAEELFQDAARMLAELESKHPGDPELAERRLRLKEQGVILVETRGDVPEEPAEELFSEEELYVDLASELEKELAEEEAMVEEATGHGKDEALLEEVFREFQRGVAEQLGEEDSDTHFNLGIAYKEMELLAEAIGEFQIAAKDPGFHLEACSMIAVCYVEQGLFDEAVRWYGEALSSQGLSDEARMALMYDLGSALLAAGREDEAMETLNEVASIDPGYRDVAEQLQTLQRQQHAN